MTITNGQTPDANEVLQVTQIEEIYTGTGYNSTGTEASYEMTAVASTYLASSNYAVIKFTGTAFSDTGAGSTGGAVQVKAQIKETGGSYADVIAYKTIHQVTGSVGDDSRITIDYTVIATLTSGMKTNGFQVKLLSQVLTASGSWTNIQTSLEVKP